MATKAQIYEEEMRKNASRATDIKKSGGSSAPLGYKAQTGGNQLNTPTPPATQAATPTYDTSAYDDMYTAYAASVDKNLQAQKDQANASAQAQLKQAYVQRLQNENKLNENMARAGIRGGASETSMMNLNNQYGQQRSTINSNLANSLREYDTAAEQNKLAYKQDVDARKRAYIENRQAEDRANARQDELTAKQWEHDAQLTKEQRAYEDKLRADERAYADEQTRKQWEHDAQLTADQRAYEDSVRASENERADRLTAEQREYEDRLRQEEQQRADQQAYYTSRYSKYDDVKSLEKRLENAKTLVEKNAINARIAELKQKAEDSKKENFTAQYGKVYDINALRSALKKTKDPTEKAIINSRIGYLTDPANEAAYKKSKEVTKKNKSKKSKSKKSKSKKK